MPETQPAARCIDVVKTYRPRTGPVHAIRGLSAEFPPGAITAVAGPSGSGKSSLLRILAGLDRPTSGSVIIGGVDLGTASHGAARLVRRRMIRYVFQRPSDNFFPQLTVDEHLVVASRHAAADTGFTPERALEALGIAPHSGRRVEELSGGEQQRAAFAQALVAGARIVIADEPTSELDAVSAARLIGSVRRLAELGVTPIVATHDAALIRAADRLVELEDGRRRRRLPASPQDRELRTRSTHRSPVVGIGAARRSGPLVLEARDLRKTYRKGPERIVAVRDATFRMHERELVGLLGRSGSGKTTLLNVVAGWEPPDAGEISRPGGTGDPPAWDEISVVPQRLGLMEELTVRENVEYPARLSGALPDLRGFIDGLMTELGLEELSDRYPGETSVGQQQRAALARALVLSPRLLLADEPSGHQDRAWTGRVFETLRRSSERGTACLAATHDEGVAPLLDRVLSMVDGFLEERSA